MAAVDRALAFAILRFTLGVNICVHGAQRMPFWASFAEHTVKEFAGVLPAALVAPYAYAIPALETIVGLLLILGLFQRATLVAGALLMASLTFGIALRGDHTVLAEQLVYELVYAALLAALSWDRYSLDRVLRRRRA